MLSTFEMQLDSSYTELFLEYSYLCTSNKDTFFNYELRAHSMYYTKGKDFEGPFKAMGLLLLIYENMTDQYAHMGVNRIMECRN